MSDYDEYDDDWGEEDDWPKMDEEEKRLGFVPISYVRLTVRRMS